MPYKRTKQPPEHKELVLQFEKAIKGLVHRFRNHPYVFYTETDMHCYLYHRLYRGGLINGLYTTAEGRDTILLHKEYPTAIRYRREDGILVESKIGRRRGAFDISIWDPKYISTLEHRNQKVLCAAELALNECGSKNPHTINDTTKLADRGNVKYGYILFFVRDSKSYELHKKKVWDNLNKAAKRVRIVFTLVNGNEKPKPQYLGAWGDI